MATRKELIHLWKLEDRMTRNARKTAIRRERKAQLVAAYGGSCKICGTLRIVQLCAVQYPALETLLPKDLEKTGYVHHTMLNNTPQTVILMCRACLKAAREEGLGA